MADFPTKVHHRIADSLAKSCGTCGYFSSGKCLMFPGRPATSPGDTCDEWTKEKPKP